MITNPSSLQVLLTTESSPTLPRLSTTQLLNAPENGALLNLWTEPPNNPSQFTGKQIAVLSTDGVEEIELTTILHYFRTRGALVHLVAPQRPSYPAYLGIQIPIQRTTQILTVHYIDTAGWIAFDKTLDEVSASEYDAFIVPGGSWNPDALRAEPNATRLLSEASRAGKIVAAVCHGPWVLSDAGVLKGKCATGWWAMRPDLENAGATYLDEAVVVDGNIVTSRGPIDLAPFVEAIGKILNPKR